MKLFESSAYEMDLIQITSPLETAIPKLRALVRARAVLGRSFCSNVAQELTPLLYDSSWIPSSLIMPYEAHYRREVLHDDESGLFTVACLTWLPGQATPIHDHRSWGIIGVASGALRSETFARESDGSLRKRANDEIFYPGASTWVDPEGSGFADIHRLGSATSDLSISIHVYGCKLSEINRLRYEDR